MARSSLNLERLLLYGAIIAGGYVVYRLVRAGGVVGAAGRQLTAAGEAIGGAVFDWLHPDAAGEQLFLATYFPESGQVSAIGSQQIDERGYFTREGIRYRAARQSGRSPTGRPYSTLAVRVIKG